jgi:hypothetical protein
MLLGVDKPQIRLQLRPQYGPVNLPLENLLGQFEDVVCTIVGFEIVPLIGSRAAHIVLNHTQYTDEARNAEPRRPPTHPLHTENTKTRYPYDKPPTRQTPIPSHHRIEKQT